MKASERMESTPKGKDRRTTGTQGKSRIEDQLTVLTIMFDMEWAIRWMQEMSLMSIDYV